MQSDREIRAIIDERIAAIAARDAGRAIAVLSEDIVAFELPPPLAADSKSVRNVEAFAGWLAGFTEIEVEMRDLHIEADQRIGFARALHHLVGSRPDGRPVSLWMRSTMGFRKEDGGWKIAHAHTSVPFYMDGSFRAAIDLEP